MSRDGRWGSTATPLYARVMGAPTADRGVELLVNALEEAAIGALEISARFPDTVGPLPILLWCPACGERHIDRGEFAAKPHHTHACQHCGVVWRPAVFNTVGVEFLPGFKDAPTKPEEPQGRLELVCPGLPFPPTEP